MHPHPPWSNIAAGFGTLTHGPCRCCPRPVGQAHIANCPRCMFPIVAILHASCPACLGIRQSVSGNGSGTKGCRTVPSGGVARPLTLTKRIFPALASRRVLLLADRFGGLRLLARKKVPRFASAGSAKTMKLFRMAFWLGVVIYNLPSPASQPAAPESQLNGSQGLTAGAVSSIALRAYT
jgi:hypothetical protein